METSEDSNSLPGQDLGTKPAETPSIEYKSCERKRLPNTRSGHTRKVIVGNFESYITINYYDNGQPGEIFITIAKQGTTIGGLCDGVAQLASLLLQVGIPWAVIKEKWVHMRFEPNDYNYSSLLDAFAHNISDMISTWGGEEDKGHSL